MKYLITIITLIFFSTNLHAEELVFQEELPSISINDLKEAKVEDGQYNIEGYLNVYSDCVLPDCLNQEISNKKCDICLGAGVEIKENKKSSNSIAILFPEKTSFGNFSLNKKYSFSVEVKKHDYDDDLLYYEIKMIGYKGH